MWNKRWVLLVQGNLRSYSMNGSARRCTWDVLLSRSQPVQLNSQPSLSLASEMSVASRRCRNTCCRYSRHVSAPLSTPTCRGDATRLPAVSIPTDTRGTRASRILVSTGCCLLKQCVFASFSMVIHCALVHIHHAHSAYPHSSLTDRNVHLAIE